METKLSSWRWFFSSLKFNFLSARHAEIRQLGLVALKHVVYWIQPNVQCKGEETNLDLFCYSIFQFNFLWSFDWHWRGGITIDGLFVHTSLLYLLLHYFHLLACSFLPLPFPHCTSLLQNHCENNLLSINIKIPTVVLGKRLAQWCNKPCAFVGCLWIHSQRTCLKCGPFLCDGCLPLDSPPPACQSLSCIDLGRLQRPFYIPCLENWLALKIYI